MAKAILIAEKPSLRRTIESVYNRNRQLFADDIEFFEQRGHLVTLKLPSEIEPNMPRDWSSLPFHPEDHGGWQYKVIKEKKVKNFLTAEERFKEINKELNSGKYDYVIHAGDPDQEGELLVDLVLNMAKNKLPVKRFWTNATTDTEVIHALQNLRDCATDPMLVNLLAAAYSRQHSDYRFGMNLSSAASLKMNGRAAIGRVKTPMLAIVVGREKAIRNYVPSTNYGVKAAYADQSEGVMCETGNEEEENGKEIIFDTEKEATDVITSLPNTGTVLSFTKKQEKSYPPKLFKLSKAQVEAGKMGYNANDTLAIIQGLYDKGYLSYPRTGCELLSSTEDFRAFLNSASVIPELAPFVAKITDSDIQAVKKNKRYVDDKAIQQEGHTALRPTEKPVILSDLTKAERDIYTMICTRYVSVFLPPLIQTKIKLLVDIGGKIFVTNGKMLVDAGYTALTKTTPGDTPVAEHKKGEIINIVSYGTVAHNSTCPSRFTSSDLVAVCENPAKYLDDKSLKSLGKRLRIGTDATRTQIIQTLIDKDGYLEVKKSKNKEYLVPTQTGEEIIENLGDCAITKVDMTGHWEEKLNDVRLGNLVSSDLEAEMRTEVERMIDEIKNKPMKSLSSGYGQKTVGKCPLCGGSVIAGKKSYFCGNYKENNCKFGFVNEILGAKITEKDATRLLNGETIEKTLKKDGREWKQKMKLGENSKLEFEKNVRTESAYTCPCCGGTMMENERNLICSNFKMDDESACHFYLPKNVCGYTFTEEDMNHLFNGEKTSVINGLVSKLKKKFDASFVLDENGKLQYIFPEAEKTGLFCPVCGKELEASVHAIYCPDHKKDDKNSCSFTGIPKEICGKEITKETAEILITGGTTGIIHDFISSKKKHFDASLKLDESGKIKFVFPEAGKTGLFCPVCGNELEESSYGYYCPGHKKDDENSCIFSGIPKELCRKSITKETAEILLNGKKTEIINGFVSKKGKSFNAALVLKDGKVEFDFGDSGKSAPKPAAPSSYRCPCCGLGMTEDNRKISCSCGFTLWKIMASKELSETEIKEILGNGSTSGPVFGLKSKKGNTFHARIFVNQKEKKTEFDFGD